MKFSSLTNLYYNQMRLSSFLEFLTAVLVRKRRRILRLGLATILLVPTEKLQFLLICT